MEMEINSCTNSHSYKTNHQSSSKPLKLQILKTKDSDFTQKMFKGYLNDKHNFSVERQSNLSEMTTGPVPSNFTPWWESFDSREKKKTRLASKDSGSQKGNGFYESWFDKSSTNADGDSWLSGPTQTPTSSNANQVKDVDGVPSIYDTVLSQPKGKRALKRERKAQREKTTGRKWFDMKMPDPDSQNKTDMALLQMRQALQAKKFFRRNDRKGLPKYFQMGTVVDEGTDFYSSRLTKKQRKQTLVEEMMADVNLRQYSKKKYQELKNKKRSTKSR